MACQNKEENSSLQRSELPTKKGFEMYEMSEMATLMEQMYAYNLQLKTKIEHQQELGIYPVFFDRLHTAPMTDASERDLFFENQAQVFLSAQKKIYVATDVVKDYNAMVQSCIACHQKKCGGPIERIKKLYISTP